MTIQAEERAAKSSLHRLHRRHATGIRPLSEDERKKLRRQLAGPAGRDDEVVDLLGRFLLAEVVNGALTALSLDELLRRLIELATSTVAAERGTIFLIDAERGELFSRVVQGGDVREIRLPLGSGIAGAVLESGRPEIVADAYADPRFNATIDQHTGYRTRTLVGVPLRRSDGGVMGVLEILNKRDGQFDATDVALLEAIGMQAAAALEHAQLFEYERQQWRLDRRLIEMAETVSAELELDRLLGKIVEAARVLLDGERASLFVHDAASGDLLSRVTAGGKVDEIRFPASMGVAGATFATGRIINVREARADPRFNPEIDSLTGFRTRSLISAPVQGPGGATTAVIQVLNSASGFFTGSDERRLQSFALQAGIALQNAQLFADVLSLKAYTDNLLRSLPDGVIKLDANGAVVSLNDAARKILRIGEDDAVPRSAQQMWGERNPWLIEALAYAMKTGGADHRPDVEFVVANGPPANVNVTVSPLRDTGGLITGLTVILQDIERQKKVQATISRYMAKEFADQALKDESAHSRTVSATILFSDIRRFTTIAEALTPQGTVDMLNEYFGEMAEIVQQHSGVVDKFIGDAIMAVFGAVVTSSVDADNAVAAACEMIRRLRHLNDRRKSRGVHPLEIGVGIASGEMVAGPVGSPNRVDYTVIGDSVNLASRLEGANKHYSTAVLLAAPTVERLKTPVRLRRIDLIRVKGKETPTDIFELLDHHAPEAAAKFDELLKPFEEGIAFYRARQWSRALDRFAAVIKILPNDGPSWVYTDRCLYYREHAPPAHWDGVWTMDSK